MNNLTSLRSGVLSPLLVLKTIDLHKNYFNVINKDICSNNLNLEEINLNNNALTLIESGSFDLLFNLRYLRLSYNHLMYAETYKAESIYLDSNKLKSMFISEMTVNIYVSNNNLEFINCTDKEMSVELFRVYLIIQI